MPEKKNSVVITIEDCRFCPNLGLKFVKELQEDVMFCQTKDRSVMLRERYGTNPIPDWCPRLPGNVMNWHSCRAKLAKLGLIDDAMK